MARRAEAAARKDPRTYRATVAHVWGVVKRFVDRNDKGGRPASPLPVFEKKIMVRKVEIEGLAADKQPSPDEELTILFHDEVQLIILLSALCV